MRQDQQEPFMACHHFQIHELINNISSVTFVLCNKLF
jgi:hypothetical protein